MNPCGIVATSAAAQDVPRKSIESLEWLSGAFEMISSGEQSVVFENLENDFPQQIIYKRERDKLTARIQGIVNGQQRSREWHWNRIDDQTAADKDPSDKSP